jgi:uncharacterized protein
MTFVIRVGRPSCFLERLRVPMGCPVNPPPPLAWSRPPEFAYGATAVSLLMPHVEPYIVGCVRRALPDIEDRELRVRTEGYLREELAHHVAHRRFNDAIASEVRGVRALDRWMRTTYRWLARTRSPRFGIAYAAGFEAVAFASARWVERHRQEVLDGAHPEAAELFLWHLAEEVHHKSVAHDVYEATGRVRRTTILATAASLVLMLWFTLVGTVLILAHERRLLHPVAWWRLWRWGLGYLFEVLPLLALTMTADHHPTRLADPVWLTTRSVDRAASTAATRSAREASAASAS